MGSPSVVRCSKPPRGVAGFLWNQWQPSRGIGGSFRLESMAGLLWNQWQLSGGTGGSFGVESVAGFTWNQWQLWRGIRNWLRVLQLLLTSCSIRSNLLPQFTSLFFP